MNPESLSTLAWVGSLPDGAVSVETQNGALVLRASRSLQMKFEELLERKKSGDINEAEATDYQAICELDDALSWLNRLARSES
ncbi:MAG: hypothetical protein ACI8UO_003880 [Verrucomicrobiales bacterium]|jgi:hypothetical protein